MRSLVEEPGPPLGLVDPVLEQACGGDVVAFVTGIVDLPHPGYQALIVVLQLGKHVLRIDIFGVVILPRTSVSGTFDPERTLDVFGRISAARAVMLPSPSKPRNCSA
jgi:hypothetical protein